MTAPSQPRLRRGRFRFAVAAAVLLSAVPAAVLISAVPAIGANAVGDVLTDWQVAAVIASYPVVRAEAGRLAGGDPLVVTAGGANGRSAPTMGEALAAIAGTSVYPQVSATLAGYGFDDAGAWALLTDRVVDAFRTDVALTAFEDLVSRLEAQIGRIRVNPQLTAVEKARAIDHLESVPPMLAPPAGNADDRPAVIPYRADLERLFAPPS